jgi:uncharacterized protein YqgC (DUF456 family)
MNTEELKKKLNRSLIFECVSIVVPSILYFIMIICTFIIGASGASEQTIGVISLLFLAIIVLISLILFIVKIVFTIIAMNSCIDYFNLVNDVQFRENSKTARISYIIAMVIGIIPLVNLASMAILIYNLIMWFNIKNRLNEETQPQNNQETLINN